MDKDIITGENSNEEIISPETAEEEVKETAAEAVEDAVETAEEAVEDVAETAEEADEETDGETDGETDEETDEEQDEDKIRICPNCHKNEIVGDHSFCRACEKKVVKVHVPLLPTLIALVTVIVGFFAFIVVCLDSAPAIQAFQGDYAKLQRNNNAAYTAYNGVSEVLDSITESLGNATYFMPFVQKGSNLDMKVFETTARASNPLSAYQNKAYIFTAPGAVKYQEKSGKFKYYEDYYQAYFDTYSALEQPLTMLSDMTEPTDEVTKKILSAMEAVRGQDKVDEVLLDYFIYNAAGMCEKEGDELYAYLDKTVEDDKENGAKYERLYINEYVDSLFRRGKYDEAQEIAERLLKEDVSDYESCKQLTRIFITRGEMDAAENAVGTYCEDTRTEDGDFTEYGYDLVLYLYRVQGKYENIHEIYNQASQTYSLEPELDRQNALTYLLEGDYDKAYEAAYGAEDKAYYRYSYYSDSSGYTDELYATAYLCACLCKQYGKCDTENAAYIDEIIESFEGRDFGEKVNAVISGEKTVEEVLTEGVCDLI